VGVGLGVGVGVSVCIVVCVSQGAAGACSDGVTDKETGVLCCTLCM
jgi:hypothetical protein